MSPHVPFITEHLYQNLKLVIDPQSELRQASVHHVQIPHPQQKLIQKEVGVAMEEVISIIETARKLREWKDLSLKQPIKSLKIVSQDEKIMERLSPFLQYILAEINVEEINA